jgi:hypothetical protein
MRKAWKKRVRQVAQRVALLPLDPKAEEEAFEMFCRTGELPEHQRLAEGVIKRALQADPHQRRSQPQSPEVWIKQFWEIMENVDNPAMTSLSHRRILFHEAVYGWEVPRLAARLAIRLLVLVGRDVTDPQLLDDFEVPDWGSVGMHLIGFPGMLATPPYEVQAQRLFARLDDLRARIDRDDEEWMEKHSSASFAFLRRGELPDDELMAEAVLAYGEMIGLLNCYLGRGDSEIMTAFDIAARATVVDSEPARAELRSLAAQGRLVRG